MKYEGFCLDKTCECCCFGLKCNRRKRNSCKRKQKKCSCSNKGKTLWNSAKLLEGLKQLNVRSVELTNNISWHESYKLYNWMKLKSFLLRKLGISGKIYVFQYFLQKGKFLIWISIFKFGLLRVQLLIYSWRLKLLFQWIIMLLISCMVLLLFSIQIHGKDYLLVSKKVHKDSFIQVHEVQNVQWVNSLFFGQ